MFLKKIAFFRCFIVVNKAIFSQYRFFLPNSFIFHRIEVY